MKKLYVLTIMILVSTVLTYCSSSKKTTTTGAKTTYAGEVATLVGLKCGPCHIPSQGGNKKAYDNYANVRADIDEIIRRIELNPGADGFMPRKRDQKMAPDTIAIFKKFKADGSLEGR